MKDNSVFIVRRKCGYHKGVSVAPIGFAGGLSLWWTEDVEMEVISQSKNVIDTIFSLNGNTPCRCTWFYGPPEAAEMNYFWRKFRSMDWKDGTPWLCGGDFNDFLWSNEKDGGRVCTVARQRHLLGFTEANGLFDLG